MGPKSRAAATVAVSLAAVIVSMGRPSGIVSADDKIVLGGGAGIAVNGDLCTLATIGHDSAGALVGFTSAHCGGPGAPVTAEGAAGTVGSVVAADDELDYAVIKFDAATVTPIHDFDGFAINGIGPEAAPLQPACKQSRANGHSCFSLRGGHVYLGPDTFSAKTPWQPGDNGTPVTVNDLLVGMIRDGSLAVLPLVPSPQPEIVSISAILNDVNAKGGPGAGFSPIPA